MLLKQNGLLALALALGPGAAAACASNAPAGFADTVDASVDATASFDAAAHDAGADARGDARPPVDAAAADVAADAPADAPLCALPCGLVAQCGCTAASTCDIVADDGGVGCVVAGTFPRGAGCTTTSACAPGLTCALGTCHELCAAADAGCANGGRCVPGDRGRATSPPNLLTCETNCELASPTACPAGASGVTNICFADPRTSGADCVGFPPSAVTTDGGCTDTQVCPAAYVCTVATAGASQGVCRRWCRVGSQDCTGCVAFSPALVRNGSTYGYCP